MQRGVLGRHCSGEERREQQQFTQISLEILYKKSKKKHMKKEKKVIKQTVTNTHPEPNKTRKQNRHKKWPKLRDFSVKTQKVILNLTHCCERRWLAPPLGMVG